MTSSPRNHAVVIGGSMAGLLAARVLARHFQQVTIVDHDAFPAVGEHRRGVPQSVHTHGLLASGRRVLERHFPGLVADLLACGALPGDIVRDSRWFFEGACLSRPTSGFDGILASRPLLEGMTRQQLLRLPNVQVMENTTAEALATNTDRSRVIGLHLHNGSVLPADLILDASGRASHAPEWLAAIGFERPQTERVEVGLAYTTRLFRRQASDLDGDLSVIIPATPHGKRGGVMIAQEGNRWTVTLMAHFGPAAPQDLAGFREFARTIPSQDIYSVIRVAEPLGEARVARFPASLRQRYEHLRRFPEGFLVFGDAISSFNPIYGQGMSVSALESEVLDRCLRTEAPNLARRFFAQAAKLVDIPWSIAVGNDLRIPETIGPRNLGVTIINWYMARLHRLGHHDAEAALAFHRVANLLAPPASVMHPQLALRVLLAGLVATLPPRKPAIV